MLSISFILSSLIIVDVVFIDEYDSKRLIFFLHVNAIFNDIINVLNEFNTSLDIKHAAHYATEIYDDILQTSHVHEEQLTMLSLAITIFRKNIQQSVHDQQQETHKSPIIS